MHGKISLSQNRKKINIYCHDKNKLCENKIESSAFNEYAIIDVFVFVIDIKICNETNVNKQV